MINTDNLLTMTNTGKRGLHKIQDKLDKLNKFGLSLIIYLISGALLLKYYQYHVGWDGISYISIAQKYLRGDFTNAVNGYWGPLFSWLLIPFLVFNLPPLLAVKLLNLMIGLFTLIGVRLLSYQFNLNEKIRSLILFTLLPIILYFVFRDITPDLLLTCLLVYYLKIIFNPNYSERIYRGILCGALGGVAYLAKQYAFPFFLVHFLLFNFLHYLARPAGRLPKKFWQNFFWGLATWAVISGSWILLISQKYHKLTIGTAAIYNQRMFGPESPSIYPHRSQGLLEPPNETAISIWEEPSRTLQKSWNPLKSWGNFKYQLKIIAKNIYRIFKFYFLFSFLWIPGIIGFFISLKLPFIKLVTKREILYLFLTFLIYPIGYFLIIVIPRFLWLNYILLLLMGGYLLSLLFQNKFFTPAHKIILILIFIVSFVVFPVKELAKNLNKGKNIYLLSRSIKSLYPIQGRIASNGDGVLWQNTFFLAYHLNTPYYGITKKDLSEQALDRELKDYQIAYYFAWEEAPADWKYLAQFKEITGKKIPGLKIYSLREKH